MLVLAIGHSARDTFAMLKSRAVPMERKAFAVGVRIEHPQEMINVSQYGEGYPKGLPTAAYKVTRKVGGRPGRLFFLHVPWRVRGQRFFGGGRPCGQRHELPGQRQP